MQDNLVDQVCKSTKCCAPHKCFEGLFGQDVLALLHLHSIVYEVIQSRKCATMSSASIIAEGCQGGGLGDHMNCKPELSCGGAKGLFGRGTISLPQFTCTWAKRFAPVQPAFPPVSAKTFCAPSKALWARSADLTSVPGGLVCNR